MQGKAGAAALIATMAVPPITAETAVQWTKSPGFGAGHKVGAYAGNRKMNAPRP
jgi:hypothetical protein